MEEILVDYFAISFLSAGSLLIGMLRAWAGGGGVKGGVEHKNIENDQ